MAGIVIKEEDIPKLKELGVKDSKLLSKDKREDLFEQVKDLAVDFKIEVVSAEEVDENLKNPNSNLNWLEADTSSRIVNKFKVDQIIVDCPSTNVTAYRDYFFNKLSQKVSRKAELIVEHKADMNYIVVGAASILAKVTRDREIEDLKQALQVDFGSGYLSDEKTQIFLKENFDKPEFGFLFRKTWKPFQNLINAKNQTSLGEF